MHLNEFASVPHAPSEQTFGISEYSIAMPLAVLPAALVNAPVQPPVDPLALHDPVLEEAVEPVPALADVDAEPVEQVVLPVAFVMTARIIFHLTDALYFAMAPVAVIDTFIFEFAHSFAVTEANTKVSLVVLSILFDLGPFAMLHVIHPMSAVLVLHLVT